jgi:uncharacterized protein (TIGR00661 family)
MDQAETPLKPNILLAPLDWGLGHATRCIPVIVELIRQNCNVFLAGDSKTKLLLQAEFPQLPFFDLKGYEVRYSKNKWTLPFIIFSQIPKILSVIQYENQRLKEIVKEHDIDGIISDNRYGLFHYDLPSVFITHQLLVKTGLGSTTDTWLQQRNYRYINRFTECWVPDHDAGISLAGELSHPEKKPERPVKYLGPLSRFLPVGINTGKHLLILLSGPEPQRSLLEELMVNELKNYKAPVILVRGLPEGGKELILPNATIYNHLPAKELNRLMNEALMVIARCGYSTVMDLAALHKKSILIPTPGQTEQEYLAMHLMKHKLALTFPQNKFRLSAALDLAAEFPYELNLFRKESHLPAAVKSFLYKIQFRAYT